MAAVGVRVSTAIGRLFFYHHYEVGTRDRSTNNDFDSLILDREGYCGSKGI